MAKLQSLSGVPSTAMVQRKKNKLVFPEAEALFQKRGRGESIRRGWGGLKWACTEQPSALSLSLLISSPTEQLPPQPGPRSRGKLNAGVCPQGTSVSYSDFSIHLSPLSPPWPGPLVSLIQPSAVLSTRDATTPPPTVFLLTATTQYS